MKKLILFLIAVVVFTARAQSQGAKMVTELGYKNCIELSNHNTRVVLEPNAGGRVLVYAYKGVNVLYINPLQNGWTTQQSQRPEGTHLSAGRYDIGPSKTKPNTDSFFFGKWEAKITGIRSAQMSKTDSILGITLIRDYQLANDGTHLTCTQTIINKSRETKYLNSWGRTFGDGGGICIVPVGEHSRFPKSYIVYNDRKLVDTEPEEENIKVKDGLLIINDAPSRPKLEMDNSEGWIAYLTKSNRIFIKKFALTGQTGEITGANTSIWYNGTQMTEIEPIGPLETLKPGAKASFSEDWYLDEFKFPGGREVNGSTIRSIISKIK